MKNLILGLIFTALAFSQALPTLPAVVTVTSQGTTCVIEFLADKGYAAKCNSNLSGLVILDTVFEKVVQGSGFFTDDILCIADDDVNGAQKFNCNVGSKMGVEGMTPTITKRRRWYHIWR
jgi:hypothetical protein